MRVFEREILKKIFTDSPNSRKATEKSMLLQCLLSGTQMISSKKLHNRITDVWQIVKGTHVLLVLDLCGTEINSLINAGHRGTH